MAQPQTYGKWAVTNRINRGGQAVIYEASSGEGNPICALKLIKATYPKKRARFVQEIKKHKELTERKTPNIIPLLDSNLEELEHGSQNGYIVMPMAKSNLQDQAHLLILRPEICLEIFQGIVSGIEEAHQIGVIHRDIKPPNVLFLEESLRTPLISDFGICFLKDTPRDERLTEENETTGSRFFRAPEQERGGIIDVKETIDIYSLGKLLHNMLTGRYLFRESLDHAFQQEEIDQDPRLITICENILSRTIVLEPNKRIQHTPELLEIIDDLLRRFKGRTTNSISTPPQVTAPSSTPTNSEDRKIAKSYYETIDYLHSQKEHLVKIQFDKNRKLLKETWEALSLSIKDHYQEAPKAAVEFIRSQPELTGMTLAIARLDAKELFQDFKQLLEYITVLSKNQSGYLSVIGVPHVYAGFLYMTASIVALYFKGWDVLYDLLNAKFEWYYQSGRPLYCYGFAHSYFFHSEAFGRNSPRIHDLFRDELSNREVLNTLGIDKDDMFDTYLQAQMIMCLKNAKQKELSENAQNMFPMFPDFGRFHAYRVLKLIDRAYNERDFAVDLCKLFNETPEQWFDKLNDRLATIQQWFQGAPYFWNSIDSYEPR